MNKKRSVKVILGSTRDGRFSDKPAAWMLEHLKAVENVDAEILDLREYPMPFFAEKETPGHKSKPYEHPAVAAWTAKIAEGDAFVIIAPEYNHGYPAVLKNALDYVYQEWNNKPVAFVSYGSALGARSVEQLREVAVELQMTPIRNALHMPYDVLVAAGKGEAIHDVLAPYVGRAQGLITQLLWWTDALKAARAQ
ncbi:NAD(P)H-dependent oxidoreductase [Candidatus Kaiserbacteria bacterium]|nr:NAD(P)H-dependent oxidoreductase [Candidatus Kaiserbacteria bacterium]